MVRTRFLIVWCAVAVVVGPVTGFAWIDRIDGSGSLDDDAPAVVTDSADDVIAVGGLRRPGVGPGFENTDIAVLKYDGATGLELWRHEIDDPTSASDDDGPSGVAVDASDDVFAAGLLEDGAGADLVVVKLSGETGAEIWRHIAPDSISASGIALDPAGDAFVGAHLTAGAGLLKLDGATGAETWRHVSDPGTVREVILNAAGEPFVLGELTLSGTDDDLFVLKIDPATGAEVWRATISGGVPGDDNARDLALDPSGHPVVAGGVRESSSLDDFVVAKFHGTTGAELWRTTIDGNSFDDGANAVAVDSLGNVFAGGFLRQTADDFFLVKLDGASGAEIWRKEIDGGSPGFPHRDAVTRLAVDAADDVIVGGQLSNFAESRVLVAMKVDGATGGELWRQELDGDYVAGSARNLVATIALSQAQDAVFGASLDDEATGGDFAVIKVDGDDGTIGGLAGKSISFRDPGDPVRRRLVFSVKDSFLRVPSPGSLADPTVTGGTVRIVNPTTLEEASFLLPAANWIGLGNPKGASGYVYKSKSDGPCTLVKVNHKKKLKVSCNAKFGSIPFSLDEPGQGSLAVSVRLGTFGPQCTSFGGDIKKDEAGKFKAKKSGGLPQCP